MKKLHERQLFGWAVAFVLVASIPYLLDLNHPRYSFIGDEWGFFELSKRVVAERFLFNPLSGGVYVVNSMFAQMIQALPMLLWGEHVWVWKLSGMLTVFTSVLLVFIWARMWFGPLVGLFSTIAYGASSYAWNFSLIGYVNPQGVLHLLLLHLLLSGLVLNELLRRLKVVSAVVGVVAGLSFYVFGGLAFPVILSPYLICCLDRENRPQLLRCFAIITAVGFLTALPGLLNEELRNALFSQSSLAAHPLTFFDRLGHGFEYLVSFAYMKKECHYAYGPYVDAVTRVGVIIGTIVVLITLNASKGALQQSRKFNGAFIVFVCTIFTALIYGFTTPYPEPPRTRGIFMLPLFAVLAGIGFGRIAHMIGERPKACMLAVVACTTIFLNLARRHQFFTLVGVTEDSCVTWRVRNALSASPSLTTIYFQPAWKHFGDQALADSFSKVANVGALLREYEIHGINIVPANEETPALIENIAVVDLNDVYGTGCRDIARKELPWYVRGLGDSDVWW